MMRGVFFDVGGTLLDISPAPTEIYHSIFEELEYGIDKETLIRRINEAKRRIDYKTLDNFNFNSKETFPVRFNKLLLKSCGIPVDDKLALRITVAFADKMRFTVFPETQKVLRALHGNYKLAAISNWMVTRSLDDILRENGILKYFDLTIASKDVKCEKPNPSIFEMALNKLSMKANEVYYLGDSYIDDVIGSLNVGMVPVFVNRRGHPNPENVINVTDLMGFISFLENE